MEILTTLKKKLEIFVEKYPIELFVDMKTFKVFIKVASKTMLENLILMNIYLQINLKGKSFDLGQ
jgi:hypothetical protein